MKLRMMWSARRRLCLGAVPALLATCAGAMPVTPAAQKDEPPITISGLLTGEGVECQALRSDKGELFTLVGDLPGFAAGQRVRVTGRRMEMSTCQQGITLRVSKIVSIKSD